MQIYDELVDLKNVYKNIVIALGTFDGVHVGHQQIINKARSLAKKIEGTSMVVTFSNHPLAIIDAENCPPQISSNAEKEKILEDLGVDVLLNIPFTPSLLSLSPKEFLSLLCKYLMPKYLVVGPNYSFGYKGRGTPQLLKDLGHSFNFIAYIHSEVYYDEFMVSSTKIRNLITAGDMPLANKLLGRPFLFNGIVCKGDQRGRLLGFPTANFLDTTDKILPASGVYITKVRIDDRAYHSITNVGINPTFDGNEKHIETHLIGFSGNLYGKLLSVEFYERIRNEKKFKNIELLKEQIMQDIQCAKKFWDLT